MKCVLILDWCNLGLRLLYVFLKTFRIQLIYQYIHALNIWLEYLLNTIYDSSIFMYVYDILNTCFMYMFYSSVICMNGTMSFCVRWFSHALCLIHVLTSRLLYLCSHMFRSSCSMKCIDHMFYVELIVYIICIHMITLGSPCKRLEVLTRTRCPDSQARKSWLGREVWITKQEVMARIGRSG